jgi:hypothetical protein
MPIPLSIPSSAATLPEPTPEGKQLGYKSILRRLAEEQKATNERLLQQARSEFGAAFDTTFLYMKDGQRHVKTKASDVAKQYLTLKGIQGYNDEECDDDD